jgi:CheY-like chemotaxis protein
MRYKKILLVANDNLEILNAQRELSTYCSGHTLHFARNGSEALSLLMGCSSSQLENYTITGKVRPDILILDADSPDLEAEHLLGVMQKYYSLQKIKVYIMAADPGKINIPEHCKPAVTGYLSKPLILNSTLHDTEKLLSEFSISKQNMFLPFLGINVYQTAQLHISTMIEKIKKLWVQFAVTAGLKAAGAISIFAAGSVIAYKSYQTSSPDETMEIPKSTPSVYQGITTKKPQAQAEQTENKPMDDLPPPTPKSNQKPAVKLKTEDKFKAVEQTNKEQAKITKNGEYKIIIEETFTGEEE